MSTDPVQFRHPTEGDILTANGFFRVNGYGDVIHYDTMGTFTHPVKVGSVEDDWWNTLMDKDDDMSEDTYDAGWYAAIDAVHEAVVGDDWWNALMDKYYDDMPEDTYGAGWDAAVDAVHQAIDRIYRG